MYEECNEFLTAIESKDRMEELADILEVISSLAKLENIKLEDVITMAKTKNIKRGGFEKRIFLERVIEKK